MAKALFLRDLLMTAQTERPHRYRQQAFELGGMQIMTHRAPLFANRLMDHPPLERFAVMAAKTDAVRSHGGLGQLRGSGMAGAALPFAEWLVT
jgi:hypothetical protein